MPFDKRIAPVISKITITMQAGHLLPYFFLLQNSSALIHRYIFFSWSSVKKVRFLSAYRSSNYAIGSLPPLPSFVPPFWTNVAGRPRLQRLIITLLKLPQSSPRLREMILDLFHFINFSHTLHISTSCYSSLPRLPKKQNNLFDLFIWISYA